jgi:hypothetical protein
MITKKSTQEALGLLVQVIELIESNDIKEDSAKMYHLKKDIQKFLKKKDSDEDVRKDCEKFIDESIGSFKMNIYPITDLDYTTAIYAAYVSGRGKSIIKKSTKAFPPKKIITEANEYVNMVRKALLHKQDREKQAYEMFLLTNGKTKEL